jgi:hypothetical protein
MDSPIESTDQIELNYFGQSMLIFNPDRNIKESFDKDYISLKQNSMEKKSIPMYNRANQIDL